MEERAEDREDEGIEEEDEENGPVVDTKFGPSFLKDVLGFSAPEVDRDGFLDEAEEVLIALEGLSFGVGEDAALVGHDGVFAAVDRAAFVFVEAFEVLLSAADGAVSPGAVTESVMAIGAAARLETLLRVRHGLICFHSFILFGSGVKGRIANGLDPYILRDQGSLSSRLSSCSRG